MYLKVHSVLCHLELPLFSTELYSVKTFLAKFQAFSSAGWCVVRASTVPPPTQSFSVMFNSIDGSQLSHSPRPARVCLNCHELGRLQSPVNRCTKIHFHHKATVWMAIAGCNGYMAIVTSRCNRLVLSSAIFICLLAGSCARNCPAFL